MGNTTQGAAHDTMPEVGQGMSLSENAEIQNNNRQEGGREPDFIIGTPNSIKGPKVAVVHHES